MRKIYVDTDLGFDVDDAASIAMLNVMKNRNLIEISAITHSYGEEKAGDAIKYINDYYGNEVPIGIEKNRPDKKCLDRFINKMDCLPTSEYPSAIDVLESQLSEQRSKDAVMLCIGHLGNLADLCSCPKGRKLVNDKISEIVIMGGNFANYKDFYEYGGIQWEGEFNIITDLESAKKVVLNEELPLSFLDFNQGVDVELNIDEVNIKEENPMNQIYRKANFLKRPSWDIVSAMYASGEFDEYFSVSPKGKVVIDEKGRTTFKEGKGNHRLVYLKYNHEDFAKIIENFYSE